MRFKSFFVVVISAALALSSMIVPSAEADVSNVDVYVTEGEHSVNGRKWRTDCDPYSQTERCFTEIWATTIVKINGKYVQKNDWVFNNLTYKASARSLWAGNNLGVTGSWVSEDGRNWRTECDTALTGQNGCRTYIESTVVTSYINVSGNRAYKTETREVFNNMVRFSAPKKAVITVPTPSPAPTVKTSPVFTPKPTETPTASPTASPTATATETPISSRMFEDPALEECVRTFYGFAEDEVIEDAVLNYMNMVECENKGIKSLEGIQKLTNLVSLDLNSNEITDLSPVAGMNALVVLEIEDNQISDLSPLVGLSEMFFVNFSGNNVSSLEPLSNLKSLQWITGRNNMISDLSPVASLSTLFEVDFGYNSITDVTPLSLLPLVSVTLDHNEISNVDSFINLSSTVGFIDLSNNKIAAEDMEVLRPLEPKTLIDWSDQTP